MASVSKSFTATGNGENLLSLMRRSVVSFNSQSFRYQVSGTFNATVILEKSLDGGQTWETISTITTETIGVHTVENADRRRVLLRFRCSAYTSGTVVTSIEDVTDTIQEWHNKEGKSVFRITDEGIECGDRAEVGVVAAPASGTVECQIQRIGFLYKLKFILTKARISVTDGAASGSYGSLKLFDFAQLALSFLGCRQNYTAFVEGAALTGGAGDAVFEIGVGTTAIAAAADGVLAAANDNVGGDVNITLSGGTGTGTEITGAVAGGVDGTTTASDLYLNWSGTAATIDANSTIDVTGTIEVVGAMLGDD